ncbi:unnamed protein product [Trichogramma brassicae]|uniref:C2H2-type domain-containing protein n=1 Tax=Trichogramma brassicae TaxID=86971 RepID=A0A6H5IYX8_9HYME|nr:unnamed protein product [Trichogramma brassicae]
MRELYSSSTSRKKENQQRQWQPALYIPLYWRAARGLCSSSSSISLVCEICHKSFGYKSDLKKHTTTVHDRSKPFECGICHKSFGPVPASRHVQHRPFVFKDLATSVLRVSSARHHSPSPSSRPYTGPHRVIARIINERNFVVDVNGVAKTLSKPTWMSPTAEHHRQHPRRQPNYHAAFINNGESPFHSLRKLPSPLGGEWLCGASKLATEHSPVAPSAGPLAPASPAAESAPVDLSHLRTAARGRKRIAVREPSG